MHRMQQPLELEPIPDTGSIFRRVVWHQVPAGTEAAVCWSRNTVKDLVQLHLLGDTCQPELGQPPKRSDG